MSLVSDRPYFLPPSAFFLPKILFCICKIGTNIFKIVWLNNLEWHYIFVAFNHELTIQMFSSRWQLVELLINEVKLMFPTKRARRVILRHTAIHIVIGKTSCIFQHPIFITVSGYTHMDTAMVTPVGLNDFSVKPLSPQFL